MPKVYQRASARRDLIEQFVYLAQNAGLDYLHENYRSQIIFGGQMANTKFNSTPVRRPAQARRDTLRGVGGDGHHAR